MPKEQLVLVAEPHGAPDLDEVALLHEVIQKRKEDVAQLQRQLESLQARITTDRVQWSGQKADEEVALRLRRQELEETYHLKTQQVDEDIRQASIALVNQRALETAAEQKVIEANQRLDDLAVLAQERVEVQLLKKQVETRSVGLEERWADAQAMQMKGQDALVVSQRQLDEVQRRTLALNEREASVKAREDAVILRDHQAELVERELDRRLEELTAPSAVKESEAMEPEPAPEGSVHAESLG